MSLLLVTLLLLLILLLMLYLLAELLLLLLLLLLDSDRTLRSAALAQSRLWSRLLAMLSNQRLQLLPGQLSLCCQD